MEDKTVDFESVDEESAPDAKPSDTKKEVKKKDLNNIARFDVVEEENEAVEEEDELEAAQREARENHDKYLRSLADLENVKKQNLRERRDLLMYAGEGLARDLLDIVDGLNLAVNQENKGTLEEFSKGIALIYSQFESVLERHSVKSESLIDQKYDPEKAEALAAVPTEDQEKIGCVLEEFKKAYYFKDKLLRPAQVVVGKVMEESKEKEKPVENSEANSEDAKEEGEA